MKASEIFLKKITAVIVQPIISVLIRRNRIKTINGIKLRLNKHVFDPAYFFSSRVFANFISGLKLKNKVVLDVGCGSGILGLQAAKQHACVYGIDINHEAITITQKNAFSNELSLTAIQSDLFDNIDLKADVIFINPPYFPRSPSTLSDYAWYAGENFEYFHRLFGTLNKVTTTQSETFMILGDNCNLQEIEKIALNNNYHMQPVYHKKTYWEVNIIYKIIMG